jgi:hypothetical protein
MTFLVRGLDAGLFAPLFLLDDEVLRARGVQRIHADEADAYPCRVSLTRVGQGTELLLLNHGHHTAPRSPYQASGPIYVSRSARTATYRGELPPMLRDRLLSLRAYDVDGFMVDADVAEGREVPNLIERLLSRREVVHVDAHFARRGCFAARIQRA